jgi:hypothetical protein
MSIVTDAAVLVVIECVVDPRRGDGARRPLDGSIHGSLRLEDRDRP